MKTETIIEKLNRLQNARGMEKSRAAYETHKAAKGLKGLNVQQKIAVLESTTVQHPATPAQSPTVPTVATVKKDESELSGRDRLRASIRAGLANGGVVTVSANRSERAKSNIY
jgi:hypothetical protein